MNLSIVSIALLVGVIGQAESAGDAGDAKQKQLQRWVEYYKEVAEGYDFRLESEPNERLEVSRDPIHVYTNPASGRDTHGAFFVWTHKGRAEAIGAIWSKLLSGDDSTRTVNHEFQSLSTQAFIAKGRDGLTWAPQGAGIELKEIPSAPEPGKSKELRLVQMRALARQFTGYHTHPTERQLRVLTQPLFRYQTDTSGTDVLDGAVFGLFMDWDPEILLVIEARKRYGAVKWLYAAGRFSDRPLRLQFRGTDVWKHPGKDFGSPRGPFFARHLVTTRPATIGD